MRELGLHLTLGNKWEFGLGISVGGCIMPGMKSSRILVMTGPGKGKTTSAFGMALRALGHGSKAAVVQFIKHDGSYGEVVALRQFPNAEIVCSGEGFTGRARDEESRERHASAARDGWRMALERLADESVGTVVLDEIFYPLNYGFIPVAEVVEALKKTGPGKVVVLTGRDAPEEIMAVADTVSRIECVKHAFEQGVKAQRKVEF